MQTYLKSLNQALRDLLRNNKDVYLLGEDIIDPYGGAFKVTKGLSTDFPDRVCPTPISEAAIVGIATGMAMRGLRPIIEIMFGDFIMLAADQIINHAAKFDKMYSGKVKVPLVIRTPMGGGRGYGPTHSQSLEKFFLGVPGLSVVSPSHFHNPGNILKYAVLEDNNPVLFIENKRLYATNLLVKDKFPIKISNEINTNSYPIIIARNYKDEKITPDVILITYGGMSLLIENIMERMFDEEIRILAILPSLLSKFPIKIMKQIIEGCENVLIIEEGTEGFNWGAEIESLFYEKFGNNYLKIRRVAAIATVIPAARHLENVVLPSVESIEHTILEVLS